MNFSVWSLGLDFIFQTVVLIAQYSKGLFTVLDSATDLFFHRPLSNQIAELKIICKFDSFSDLNMAQL